MNLMKATLLKLWRLTRSTSMVVGLAVMLALVAGGAPLAVASTPSGGGTAAVIFKGVSNVETTVTTLINRGLGAALSLRVQPGAPPLTVNADAGTATNLSADKLDGKDSTAFVSAIDGKAPDSDRLDGKDSTEFLGATAKATDADRLDGRDSTDFLGATAKAADSDKLDGKDSTDFARAGTAAAFTAVQPGSVTLPNAGTDVVVVSKVVPAGSYAINAKVSLQNKDDDDVANTDCALKAGGAFVNVSSLLTLGPNTGGQELDHVGDSKELPLQGDVANFGGGAIAVGSVQ